MNYVRILCGALLCSLMAVLCVPVYANDQVEITSSVAEDVTSSYEQIIPPLEIQPIAPQEDTSSDSILPPVDDGLHDSFEFTPIQPTSPDLYEAASAVLQIRSVLIFLVFGIFPLLCACLILYLLFHWIYGLIMSVI